VENSWILKTNPPENLQNQAFFDKKFSTNSTFQYVDNAPLRAFIVDSFKFSVGKIEYCSLFENMLFPWLSLVG